MCSRHRRSNRSAVARVHGVAVTALECEFAVARDADEVQQVRTLVGRRAVRAHRLGRGGEPRGRARGRRDEVDADLGCTPRRHASASTPAGGGIVRAARPAAARRAPPPTRAARRRLARGVMRQQQRHRRRRSSRARARPPARRRASRGRAGRDRRPPRRPPTRSTHARPPQWRRWRLSRAGAAARRPASVARVARQPVAHDLLAGLRVVAGCRVPIPRQRDVGRHRREVRGGLACRPRSGNACVQRTQIGRYASARPVPASGRSMRRICVSQVVQQHRPAMAVRHQPMHDEQQPVAGRPAPVVRDPDQRPVREIEALLQRRAVRGDEVRRIVRRPRSWLLKQRCTASASAGAMRPASAWASNTHRSPGCASSSERNAARSASASSGCAA